MCYNIVKEVVWMKTKIASFIYIVFFALFLYGCSNENKVQFDLDKETLDSEYIVGENIQIKELKIKVNNSDVIISENDFELGNVDNTLVGEQNMDIKVNYKGVNKTFKVNVIFDIPAEVKELKSKIDCLPEKNELNFSHYGVLQIIENSYSSLSDFYKSYVDNYDIYLESKIYLDNFYIQNKFN